MKHISIIQLFGVIVGYLSIVNAALGADSPKIITLLHTNDLHSQFKPVRNPLNLGGFARLKTLVTSLRRENPEALLVDAGDWSEGSIYYNDGSGLQSLKMLDHLGYDVVSLGNHDFLNGPDTLLEILEKASPRFTLVSANLNMNEYEKREGLQKWISPYTIRQVGDVKIAFIGLTTYELIYDKYFFPVKIREPFLSTADLSARLKAEQGVDVVVVVSHNSTLANQAILKAAPQVDLVIGGHDHKVLIEPKRVSRLGGSPGWIVEAGEWGKFLGQVTLRVDSRGVELLPERTRLIQVDARIPEDMETRQKIEEVEARLEAHWGRIFHEPIGESRLELNREGMENTMGNFAADAYLKATQADVAIESSRFMSGDLHEGPVYLADVYNTMTQIYNPQTDRSWNLHTLPVSGRTLKWLLYAFFVSKKVSAFGLMNVAGLSFTYDPFFLQTSVQLTAGLDSPQEIGLGMPSSFPNVKDIQIQGRPLDPNTRYRVALGYGIIEAFRFIQERLWSVISLDDLQDTGMEAWRVLADSVRVQSPLRPETVSQKRRMSPQVASLGLRYADLNWTPLHKTPRGQMAQVRVRVTNQGVNTYDPRGETATVQLVVNQNAARMDLPPAELPLGSPLPLSTTLAQGESHELLWEVEIPESLGAYPITARLDGVSEKIDHSDDEVTRWFVQPKD